MKPTHISVKDLAGRWGCPKSAIYQQVNSGGLDALRIGGTIRIPSAAVVDFERRNTTSTAPKKSRQLQPQPTASAFHPARRK